MSILQETRITTKKSIYRILCISDTHFVRAKDYQIMDLVFNLYTKKKCDLIVHCGDILDGCTLQPIGLDLETYLQSQIGAFVSNMSVSDYPFAFITGNHDQEITDNLQIDLGKTLARTKEGFTYLGPRVADLIINNIKIRLIHRINNKGTYRGVFNPINIQRALDDGVRTQIIGHTHTWNYHVNRALEHCFLPACSFNEKVFWESSGCVIYELHFTPDQDLKYTTIYQYENEPNGRRLNLKKEISRNG